VPIELPVMPGLEFHYEGEIAIVIGTGGEDLDDAGAEAAILGFTGALDITLRLETEFREERSMRKSYRTFTPTGPAILPYRPEHAKGLGLVFSVNGEQRQQGTLDQLVLGVIGLVKLASSIVRLEPGDLILTGTPSGVGQLLPGDRASLAIDGIPPLELDVIERKA
jgi:2-keto-4-pentenoate hydratase/2-oxohepta-3-ene-1,7-dioic acid hydratase in catechol pathway